MADAPAAHLRPQWGHVRLWKFGLGSLGAISAGTRRGRPKPHGPRPGRRGTAGTSPGIPPARWAGKRERTRPGHPPRPTPAGRRRRARAARGAVKYGSDSDSPAIEDGQPAAGSRSKRAHGLTPSRGQAELEISVRVRGNWHARGGQWASTAVSIAALACTANVQTERRRWQCAGPYVGCRSVPALHDAQI
jgi:hypothetical protein